MNTLGEILSSSRRKVELPSEDLCIIMMGITAGA